MAAADLELVIRAQDAASATLAKISGQISNLGSSAQRDMARAEGASKSLMGGLSALGGALAAAGGVSLLRNGLGSAVTASNQLQSALIGLSSVATGFGHNASQAQAVAMNLSSNGLIPVTQSATALKNLLASGFSIPEATALLDSLANKAAFNKQSFYDLGGAVVATTEGIKNGNSVLADATGTTTNLSVMAKQAGISIADMGNVSTSSALRAAYLNGFIKDSATSMGDLDRLSKTSAGSQAQFGFAVNQTSARLGQLVSVGLQPILQKASQFISANQGMIVSALAAGAAMLAFGVAVVGIAGAIAVAVAIVGGPLTLVLMAVAALLGTVVYGAAQKLQSQMGSMFKSFTTGSGGMANAAKNDMGAASKKAEELADKLADISAAVLKANRDFSQSLTDILKTSQGKISDLSKQIRQETDSFEQAQADRTASFTQAMDDQKLQHERKVADIAKDLDRETLKGRFADQTRISDLKERLRQENDDYARSTNDKQTQYNKDTANAKAQSTSKLTDLQTQLATETGFLARHASDLQGIRASNALDEIDKLKQSHADQMREFDKQRVKAIQSAASATQGMANQFNGLPSMVNPNMMNGVGASLGKGMGDALKNSFTNSFNDLMNSMQKSAGKFLKSFDPGLGFNFAMDKLFGFHGSSFASGTRNFSGGMALVGENGPEYVNLPRGADVFTAPQTRQMSGGGGSTINQTNNIYNQVDMDVAVRDLSWRMQRA